MPFFRGTLEEFKKTMPSLIVSEEFKNDYDNKLAATFFKSIRTYVVVDGNKFWMKIYPEFRHYGKAGLGSVCWRHNISKKNPCRSKISDSMGDMDHFGGGHCPGIKEAKEQYIGYIRAALVGRNAVYEYNNKLRNE